MSTTNDQVPFASFCGPPFFGIGLTWGQLTYNRDVNGHKDTNDTAGTWTWLLDDDNGNTATHAADDGTVVEQAAFDPYGRPETGGTGKKTAAPGSTLGYESASTDRTTGAVSLGARLYDPHIGQFLTQDTFLSSAADLSLSVDLVTGNRYAFAAANPVAFAEDGHGIGLKKWWKDHGSLVIAAGGIVAGAIACSTIVGCVGVAALVGGVSVANSAYTNNMLGKHTSANTRAFQNDVIWAAAGLPLAAFGAAGSRAYGRALLDSGFAAGDVSEAVRVVNAMVGSVAGGVSAGLGTVTSKVVTQRRRRPR